MALVLRVLRVLTLRKAELHKVHMFQGVFYKPTYSLYLKQLSPSPASPPRSPVLTPVPLWLPPESSTVWSPGHTQRHVAILFSTH